MNPRSRAVDDVAESLRIHLIQGEHRISADPQVMITTTLGSCVAACLRDSMACVGGMNHFLLPSGEGRPGQEGRRFGAYAMELLINALLRAGARRERLEAKLFGGACLSVGLPNIGAQNVSFAERFLQREGIQLIGGSTGGRHGRRVQFWPVSGRARQLAFPDADHELISAEGTRRPKHTEPGQVELFSDNRA